MKFTLFIQRSKIAQHAMEIVNDFKANFEGQTTYLRIMRFSVGKSCFYKPRQPMTKSLKKPTVRDYFEQPLLALSENNSLF